MTYEGNMESPGRSRLLAGPGLWGTLWSKPYGHTHLAFFDLKIMGGGGMGGGGWDPPRSSTRAQLLEAWLALTSVKYLDNVLVLILLNQWLKLTIL